MSSTINEYHLTGLQSIHFIFHADNILPGDQHLWDRTLQFTVSGFTLKKT